MILRGINIYSSQYEKILRGIDIYSESEESFKDKGEDTYPCDVDLFMIRRILND